MSGDDVGELAVAAEELRASVLGLQQKIAFNRRVSVVLAGLAGVVTVALVVLVLVVLNLYHANNRIQDSLRQNYVTAQQQSQTRVKVLCPLYGLFLGAIAEPSQPSAATPKQLADDLKIIEDGYRSLGCQPALPTTP